MAPHRVTFLPQDVAVEVPAGALIVEAAREAGLSVHQPCGGQGSCGRCAVILKEGQARRRSAVQIGRASCRGRGEVSGGGGSLKKSRGNKSRSRDWTSAVCSSDLSLVVARGVAAAALSFSRRGRPAAVRRSRSEERRVGEGGRFRGAAGR